MLGRENILFLFETCCYIVRNHIERRLTVKEHLTIPYRNRQTDLFLLDRADYGFVRPSRFIVNIEVAAFHPPLSKASVELWNVPFHDFLLAA